MHACRLPLLARAHIIACFHTRLYTQTDLKKKRQVSEKDGRRWANQHGFEYFETSAANGQNVNEMFTYVFQTVVRTLPER